MLLNTLQRHMMLVEFNQLITDTARLLVLQHFIIYLLKFTLKCFSLLTAELYKLKILTLVTKHLTRLVDLYCGDSFFQL